MADLWVLPRPVKSLQNGPDCKYARTAFAKRKRAICPKHQIVRWESLGERYQHLGERGRSEREHGQERADSAVKEGNF